LERKNFLNEKQGNDFNITTKERLFKNTMQPLQNRDAFSQTSSRIQNEGSKAHELLKQPANYIEQ